MLELAVSGRRVHDLGETLAFRLRCERPYGRPRESSGRACVRGRPRQAGKLRHAVQDRHPEDRIRPDQGITVIADDRTQAYERIVDWACPGGCLVLVGMPPHRASLDVVGVQAKELRIESVFRYANIFPRALQLLASGQIDVKRFITRSFVFADAIAAFEAAAAAAPEDVKIQIELPAGTVR